MGDGEARARGRTAWTCADQPGRSRGVLHRRQGRWFWLTTVVSSAIQLPDVRPEPKCGHVSSLYVFCVLINFGRIS